MIERQPNQRLLEHIGFQPPPHRIEGGRSPVAVALARLAALFLLLVAVALPVSVMGFTSEARALLTDSALSLGLGSPAPEVRVSLRECDFYRSTGRYGTSGWDCLFDLAHRGATRGHAVELDSEGEARLHQGAGIAFGNVGLYWPAGVMLGRWLGYVLLFVLSAGLLYVCYVVAKAAPRARELALARNARVCTVDLLTRGGQAWFAFLDQSGTRRFQQAESYYAPLHLDALLTTGIALAGGQTAILLDAALRPLKLPEDQRKAMLAKVDEIFMAGRVRRTLPPQPGDADTTLGRIERIEAELAVTNDPSTLARLYNDAWRLSWDNDEADLAGRVFDARDAIALRLGPERAWSALRQSREQFVTTGS